MTGCDAYSGDESAASCGGGALGDARLAAGSCAGKLPRTLWWGTDDDGRDCVFLIDQTKLPVRDDILRCRSHGDMVAAIKSLALRGAPAIGVGGAFAMALWALNESRDATVGDFLHSMDAVGRVVADARPTAVNLSWGVRKVCEFAQAAAAGGGKAAVGGAGDTGTDTGTGGNADVADAGCAAASGCAGAGATEPFAPSLADLKLAIRNFALSLYREDIETNMAIARNGAALLAPSSRVMTHCNAGSLATVFYGTALGVIYAAFDQGRIEHVYACETRPVNQGGRLTAWELVRAGVPATLICDNMAATVMSKGMVDAVIVGADRIAANGDTANKIGTMGHAVLAKHFGIPFYVAAPFSTIDASTSTGAHIRIEERDSCEVRGFAGSGSILASDAQHQALDLLAANGLCRLSMQGGSWMDIHRENPDKCDYGFDIWVRNTPEGVGVFNPAFDVTPCNLISGIITERGVFAPDSSGEFHF